MRPAAKGPAVPRPGGKEGIAGSRPQGGAAGATVDHKGSKKDRDLRGLSGSLCAQAGIRLGE